MKEITLEISLNVYKVREKDLLFKCVKRHKIMILACKEQSKIGLEWRVILENPFKIKTSMLKVELQTYNR